jgi:hypothetical protein
MSWLMAMTLLIWFCTYTGIDAPWYVGMAFAISGVVRAVQGIIAWVELQK